MAGTEGTAAQPLDRHERDPDGRDPDGRDPDDRDRDEVGRARNARPRDKLGRPLPRGETGVERTPDEVILPPAEALAEAQRLLDMGRAFQAHEVLEATWKAAPESERELWRGLAQLAVGITHLQRGNPAGAVALLSRAADRISAYADTAPYDIAVADLVDWARDVAGRVERDGSSVAPPATPLLRVTPGDDTP
jgi:uncharacterized protein